MFRLGLAGGDVWASFDGVSGLEAGVVRIGINPIIWSNDDMPELGGDIPLAACLAETKLAGYGWWWRRSRIRASQERGEVAGTYDAMVAAHVQALSADGVTAALRARHADREIKTAG